MNNRNLTPIFLVVAMVVGILIGTFYASHFMGNRLNIINTGSNKLNYLLQLVDNNYVDTVDMSEIVEESMPLILSELDPHSAYIPAKDAEAETQDLKGFRVFFPDLIAAKAAAAPDALDPVFGAEFVVFARMAFE